MTDEETSRAAIALAPGLRKAYFDEGLILALYVSSVHRQVVDVWFQHFLEFIEGVVTARQGDSRRQILTMHVFESVSVTLTPYARARLSELSAMYPQIGGRTAVVASTSHLATEVISVALRLLNQAARTPRQRNVFHTPAEALDWLRKGLMEPHRS